MRTALCRTLLGLGLPAVALGILPLAAQQAPKNLQATIVSPTKVKLAWTGGTNAVSHRVLRGIGTHAPTTIHNLPSPGVTYTDASAPAGTALVYQVLAKYPNNSTAYSGKISVTTPAGTNTASTTPPATSPPTASSPAAIPSSPVLSAVPVLRTATLAPVTVAPTPATPAPAAAPAAATPVSGRYRVVANGFSVVHESFDDFLSRDGRFDEVYGGFLMFHYDRKTGNLLDRDLRRTKVLGDVNNFPDRLRAGSASGSGGLKRGDSYPDAGHARYRGHDGMEPNDQTFPFKVWEGTLTDGADAAIILPTMWEQDNDGSTYELWQSSEVSAASQIWFDGVVQQALKQTSLGVIAPPGSITPNMVPTFGTEAAAATGFFAALGHPWVGTLFAGSRDRPIGLTAEITPKLPRRAIVLTREIVEKALNGSRVFPNPASLAPPDMWMLAYLDVPVGVIPVLLRDGIGNNLQAIYVMYLQVERM